MTIDGLQFYSKTNISDLIIFNCNPLKEAAFIVRLMSIVYHVLVAFQDMQCYNSFTRRNFLHRERFHLHRLDFVVPPISCEQASAICACRQTQQTINSFSDSQDLFRNSYSGFHTDRWDIPCSTERLLHVRII